MRSTSRSIAAPIAWHTLAILTLMCVPLLKFQEWWWRLSSKQLAPFAVLLAAYGLSAAAAVLLVRDHGLRGAARALVTTLGVFAVAFALLLFAQLQTPRYLLAPIFGAALILVPLSMAVPRLRIPGAIVLAAVLLVTAGYATFSTASVGPNTVEATASDVRTAFYNVHVTTYKNVVPLPATRGGGLEPLGQEVLLADGGGSLYVLSFDEDGAPRARALPTKVPLNREEFAVAFGGSSQAPKYFSGYSETGPPKVQTWRFRVADVLTQVDGDDVRIFASHHQYNAQRQCYFVRVSAIEAALSALDESLRSNAWRTVYDSQPCVPMTGEQRKLGKNPFKGEEVGGRMALLDADTLLLTLGDLGFSGIESLGAYSQDPQAHYGKTMRIDLNTQTSEVFTLGHRNAQGLHVAGDGRIWLAEHGAQGGDEINLLQPGANYGWPQVTYGADYGAFAWPLATSQGRHEGFTQPAYAWVPSIGLSALIGLEGDLFDIWRGDLLAGSLATRSLYRLVIDGERIVLSEPIQLGARVRDLMELDDGRVLVWGDEGLLLTVEPSRGMSGALTFSTLCTGCHISHEGLTHRIGPDLFRIVGRPVARAEGFEGYSDALRNFGGEWTRERLDAYLRDPQATVPGTAMAFAGVKDDAERAALLDHLATLVTPPKR